MTSNKVDDRSVDNAAPASSRVAIIALDLTSAENRAHLFARGEELGCNIMTVAHARLLCGECLYVIARFFFAPSSLQIHVPLRILEIDADPALPSGREEIFIFLGGVVRAHELGIVGHRVEQ